MVTDEDYKNALTIIDQYRKQSMLPGIGNRDNLDVYEWLRAEMMASTDITLEEFDEVLQMWITTKKKEFSIAEFDKNYR